MESNFPFKSQRPWILNQQPLRHHEWKSETYSTKIPERKNKVHRALLDAIQDVWLERWVVDAPNCISLKLGYSLMRQILWDTWSEQKVYDVRLMIMKIRNMDRMLDQFQEATEHIKITPLFSREEYEYGRILYNDLLSSTQFMLTHTRYLIYILIHYKLRKNCNNRFKKNILWNVFFIIIWQLFIIIFC